MTDHQLSQLDCLLREEYEHRGSGGRPRLIAMTTVEIVALRKLLEEGPAGDKMAASKLMQEPQP